MNASVSSGFANFAHFNSHTTAQNANANADFANFDAFGSASGSTGGFPSAPQAPFHPSNTAFTVLSSSCSMGEFAAALPLQVAHSSASGGLANANFANFDNFPKSCSADFGSFSSSCQSNSTGAGRDAVQSTSLPADRYAALADLDNVFSSAKTEQGSGIPVGGSSAAAAGVAGLPEKHPAAPAGGDRYAALAELDTVFGPSAPVTSVYNTSNTSQGGLFGPETGMPTAQAQHALPGMAQGFGAQSTNPFVAAPSAAPTNPFQSNGRTANMAVAAAAAAAAASFGTGSMSMPAGFGNAAAFNLPTSFSGTFQQPFPGQAPFPQPPVYPQQPNGGGFPAFGQAKPFVTPFGQAMTGPMASSNPFLGAAGPSAQYPAGGSSTNPFL